MEKLRFDTYEVHPVKDFGDHAEVVPDAEADFWSVYGRLPNMYIAIGDFHCREAADMIVELLDSKKNPGLPPS